MEPSLSECLCNYIEGNTSIDKTLKVVAATRISPIASGKPGGTETCKNQSKQTHPEEKRRDMSLVGR